MKKFFQKIVNFLHLLFGGSLDQWITEHVQPSIEFVQKFKSIVDSPVTNILTALIPGDWDDKLRQKMSDNLGKAIDILMAGSQIAAEPDWTNKILQTISLIKSFSPDMQSAVYNKLAGVLTKLSAGDAALESVKNHSVDLLVQLQYSKMKENATAENLPDDTTAAPDTNTVQAPVVSIPADPAPAIPAPATTAVQDPATPAPTAATDATAAPDLAKVVQIVSGLHDVIKTVAPDAVPAELSQQVATVSAALQPAQS